MVELENVVNEIKSCFIEPFENNILSDFLLGNSKRIRSNLAILYLKSLGCEINSSVYKILACGEIIHTASLLHDDVLDEALIRRENITISQKYSSKISVLSGDYLISYGIEKLIELNNFEILKIFKNATKEMSKAEIRQLLLRGKYPEKQVYIDICLGKTACLFASILESVALLSGINSEKARKFGKLFGLVFQLKNDIETSSALQDKKNGIYTAYDILGIEKTTNLLDNYKREMRDMVEEFSDSEYKFELERLIND